MCTVLTYTLAEDAYATDIHVYATDIHVYGTDIHVDVIHVTIAL